MSLLSMIVLGIGLAMDCFAVSIASGIKILEMNRLKLFNVLKIAVFFGVFQAGMTVLGWFLGSAVKEMVTLFDHWIAFGLLLFIGGKMVYEGFEIEEAEKKINPLELKVLFMLSVATSIDALAVGITLSFIDESILLSAAIIGGITFGLSCLGIYIGKKVGHLFENKIEIFGGLILIGIGVKILIQHLIEK